MRCDFCGFTFDMEASKKGCAGCPMNKSCGKVKCPNCNYEMVEEVQIKTLQSFIRWGKKLWKR